MRTLIVYESMFGNTQAIAEAIATGLGESSEIDVTEVSDAPPTSEGYDLVVVGGPTHAFGMSRSDSRQNALKETDQPLVSQGIGIREWIKALPEIRTGAAAAFDTKIRKPNLPGSAAKKAEKRMRRRGYDIVVQAENFLVEGTTGPLTDGELSRAQEWGADLVENTRRASS